MIGNVLSIFKPMTFSITFFTEKASGVASTIPFDLEIDGYTVKHKSVSELEGNCDVVLVNYESSSLPSKKFSPKKVKLPKVLKALQEV